MDLLEQSVNTRDQSVKASSQSNFPDGTVILLFKRENVALNFDRMLRAFNKLFILQNSIRSEDPTTE